MKSILAAVDMSDDCTEVIDTARSFASAFNVALHLLHAADPDPEFVGMKAGPQSVRDSHAEELKGQHHLLMEMTESLRKNGIEAHAHFVKGPTASTIIDESEKLNAGLIVMGSHRRGAIARAVLGSVSEPVLRKSQCPVVIVPVQVS